MKRDLVKPLGSKKQDFVGDHNELLSMPWSKWQIIVQDIEVEVFKQYKIIMEQVALPYGIRDLRGLEGVVLLVLHGYVNRIFLI
jgi:hypothetical protein